MAKVNAAGTGLIYCGYIGGAASDYGGGIALDSSVNAYITGTTYSTEAMGFPVLVGPDLTFNGGLRDAFVARVKDDGTGLDYCGYIGGGNADGGSGIAVDNSGNVYVTGLTESTEASFPEVVGPDLTYNGGTYDVFVAKVVFLPTIHYVDDDANGADDGSSWPDAFNYLQDALAAARSGDQIWVAEGTYKPDQETAHPNGTDDRAATFQLKNEVVIKGGYAGFGEPDPNKRKITIYETILSGDLAGNDIDMSEPGDLASEPARSDNCYHVVTLQGQQDVRIDGFTITGGNTNEGGGGGMVARNWPADCSGTIANCRFEHNVACMHGGGLNLYGSVDVINCTFSGNISHSYGGAVSIKGHDNYSKIENCTFQENISELDNGGAICVWLVDGKVTISDSVFVGNVAEKGGAIEFDTGADIIVNGCILQENIATIRGAAINILYCGPVIINCVFTDNSSAHYGGAIVSYGVSSYGLPQPTIVNCTLVQNSAQNGGAIASLYNSDPKITNCILWANEDRNGVSELGQVYGGTPLINYCCLQDCTGLFGGTGNMGADPCFVDAVNGDYHLLAGSLCVDAGHNNSLPADTHDLDSDGNTTEPIPFDLAGNARIIDGDNDGNSVVDMGAYESWPPIEVSMKFTPQSLNPRSKGNWMKAHFVLPEGFIVEDVDANTPAVVQPGDIESDYMNVFINDDGLVEIEAAFDRAEFCGIVTGDEPMEVRVVGSLTSGQQFYGTDTIKITTNNLKYLAILASRWLETGCGKPDWCGGADLDQDSLVNFSDFALFDGCCIEVVKE